MNTLTTLSRSRFFWLAAALLVTGALYLSTLQTIPNGSSQYYMIDVGETQIVLNRWGTLHATGYPHYVITGSAITAIFRLFGVDEATAPALVSLMWGLLALGLVYTLALHLSENPPLSALLTVAFGLTRTVWIHASIAEIYAFGLVLLVALLLLALWKTDLPHLTDYPARIYWMALIGGIAVAHHRAFAMAIPALLVAVAPRMMQHRKSLPQVILVSLALGLLGFLPYVYLPLREMSGERWVYGDTRTLQGFIDQFMGTEAGRFIGLPNTLEGLRVNFTVINTVLVRDLTVPGILLGILGLIIGIWRQNTRRAALVMTVNAGVAYAFHVALYTDVLSALILPVTLGLAFGWLFLTMAVTSSQRSAVSTQQGRERRFGAGLVSSGGLAMLCAYFVVQNFAFIKSLTTDRTGLETVALVEDAPPGSMVMLAWGPRYFAAGFEKDVRGGLDHVTLVDDKADFTEIAASGSALITPDYTFYNQPPDWWQSRLNQAIYLRAAAPGLIEIGLGPRMTAEPLTEAVGLLADTVICEPERFVLDVTWSAGQPPERDLSVFVHLQDEAGNVIAQDDKFAPVYGWRPLTGWQVNEAVRDVYVLPRLPHSARIHFGLYYQAADAAFVNVVEYTREATCG
ncbi:MAG: DUF2723 domain-containing protein [bacterium]|nr:DUF2723 domain-containing protein [bacterium]